MARLSGFGWLAPRRIASVGAILLLIGVVATADDAKPAAAAASKTTVATKPTAVSYHAAILPLLQTNCQGCHQPAKASGKLDLTSFKNMLAAGESGSAALVPGKPDESYLLDQITPDKKGEAAMPQGK